MFTSDFAAAAVLITFGAVLGKLSPIQYVVLSFFEIIVFQVNEYIGLSKFKVNIKKRVFCMPLVLFPFEFESERPYGNSVSKQLPNYHSSNLEKSVKWQNINLVTVLSPNSHSAL